MADGTTFILILLIKATLYKEAEYRHSLHTTLNTLRVFNEGRPKINLQFLALQELPADYGQ